jgi:hypothetical protein
MQFVIGFTVTGIFNVCNTLIVDINPSQPVIASASVSITRCLLAAGGVAAIGGIVNAIGQGWAFTILGALGWATLPMMWIARRKGWAWRLRDTVHDEAEPGSVTTPVEMSSLEAQATQASNKEAHT